MVFKDVKLELRVFGVLFNKIVFIFCFLNNGSRLDYEINLWVIIIIYFKNGKYNKIR